MEEPSSQEREKKSADLHLLKLAEASDEEIVRWRGLSEAALEKVLSLNDDKGWKKGPFIEVEGVVGEKMSIPGSAVDAWKVTGEINCSPEEALDQMWAWTESRWKRFNQNILLWEILFDSQGDLRICHQLDKLPWPLQPRDSLTVNIKKQTDKKTIILWCDNTEEVGDFRSEWKCPSSCVRATVNFVAYIFEPVEDPRKSKLTHIVNLDPNGLLPPLVVNNFTNGLCSLVPYLSRMLRGN
eukprot:TRINITY_DN3247_c0_g1_i5.p1 TRINITY_DN3247_c0_g1~~TRINITY_DN3247_c0_g1_i5.p1  ORF type:complete len:240 (-),score=48.29 TRINITY_DN3247_c0_g1_i5:185-904(-)